jgi:hypothetical protein
MRLYTFLVVTLILASISSLPLCAADLSAEDVVSKHLQSIGSPDAIKAAKSRVVEGSAVYKILIGGAGQIEGKAVFVSEEQKTHLLLKISNYQYLGERLVWNGEKTGIAAAYPDKRYSEFGDFLKGQDAPIREGLLGGVLTTAWPLLDLNSRKSKVSYEGLKKFEGKELCALRYKPKKNTDLSILMYFDPANFHHVATVYTLSIEPRISFSEVETARGQQTRYRIEERFADFKTIDGLSLPSHYELRFTAEVDQGSSSANGAGGDAQRVAESVSQGMQANAQRGAAKSVEWDVNLTQATDNVKLDARNFDIK